MLLSGELGAITLHVGIPDKHVLATSRAAFSSHDAYALCASDHPADNFAPHIWQLFAPSRCKLFL